MKQKRGTHAEAEWDRLLNIRTAGRDDSFSSHMNFPYEPTDYPVLERLANEGYIRKDNCLLDYGCGKGRVEFFLSYQTRCRSIGIDYDPRMIQAAEDNKEKAVSGTRTDFFCENAVHYRIPSEVDRIYFFNPFSVELLESVLIKISDSCYADPRELLLFFYYPSDEYVASLMLEDTLEFMDEISCQDLFPAVDERERIMIFRSSV